MISARLARLLEEDSLLGVDRESSRVWHINQRSFSPPTKVISILPTKVPPGSLCCCGSGHSLDSPTFKKPTLIFPAFRCTGIAMSNKAVDDRVVAFLLNDSVDLTKVFDDEDSDSTVPLPSSEVPHSTLHAVPKSFPRTFLDDPIGPLRCKSEDGSALKGPTQPGPQLIGNALPAALESEQVTQFMTGKSEKKVSSQQQSGCDKEGLVDVYLIVDPAKKKLIFPSQVISYTAPGGTTSSTLIGTSVINDVAMERINSDLRKVKSQHPLQQQQVPDNDLFPKISSDVIPPCYLGSLNDAVMDPSSSLSDTVEQRQHEQEPKPTNSVDNTKPAALPPQRALSAYNFFFRDERERYIHGVGDDCSSGSDGANITGGRKLWTKSEQDRILEQHWLRDRTKKRKHRKSHGKIDFTSLSKLISKRWKALSEEQKNFYREIATRDWERYNFETAQFKCTNL